MAISGINEYKLQIGQLPIILGVSSEILEEKEIDGEKESEEGLKYGCVKYTRAIIEGNAYIFSQFLHLLREQPSKALYFLDAHGISEKSRLSISLGESSIDVNEFINIRNEESIGGYLLHTCNSEGYRIPIFSQPILYPFREAGIAVDRNLIYRLSSNADWILKPKERIELVHSFLDDLSDYEKVFAEIYHLNFRPFIMANSQKETERVKNTSADGIMKMHLIHHIMTARE